MTEASSMLCAKSYSYHDVQG